MYAAKSASLRSSDLSRQVGAAIFTDDGELITQGCNEVPKAFGGTYWDLEAPDWRDVKLGYDPNENLKRELLRDLFERLLNADMLSDKAKSMGTPLELISHLTKKIRSPEERSQMAIDGLGILNDAMVMDLTEYGRVVHAEMCAICDAARNGRPIKKATLYCTTFPCHNCTKHILTSGLKQVIYIEPYPKSKAKDLHGNEIELEKLDPDRVSYMPFLGISPFRYRDIFQRGRRKDSAGNAKRWISDVPKPQLDIALPSYTDLESAEFMALVGKIETA